MLLKQKLAQLLKAHWTEILDQTELMKVVLENVRDGDFPIRSGLKLRNPNQTVVSVTHFAVEGDGFVIWIEFQAPREGSMAIGTQVYNLGLNGKIHLQKNYGTVLL